MIVQRSYFVEQVWSVEGGAEREASGNIEHLLDVSDDARGGSGSQSQDGHATELRLHDRQELVIRPEVVAPLRAAVHLVDDQSSEPTRFVHLLQLVHEPAKQ